MLRSIRIGFSCALATLLTVAATANPVWSQSTTSASVPSQLSIEDAIRLAEQYNPDYLQVVSNRAIANAASRSAKGALLPQLHATLSAQGVQGGQQLVNGTAISASSSTLSSSYNIGISMQLSKSTFVNPRLQSANVRAADEDIRTRREELRAAVRQQYFSVLQSQEILALQDTLIASAEAQVELARGRAAVGSGTQLDVQRAEIALGQQQVQQLKVKNQLDIDRLRLFQQIGVPMPAEVQLTSQVDALPATPALNELLSMARQENPALSALRHRQRAAGFGVSSAKGSYWPTLTLSTGLGGQTYQYRDADFPVNQAQLQASSARASCIRLEEARAAAGLENMLAACDAYLMTDAQIATIRSSNDKFPFGFSRSPISVTAQLSLPIFDGFLREQRVQEAKAQERNARYLTRAQELALTTDVTAAYYTLLTANKTLTLQQENSAKAREELQFTEQQYEVGLSTFVDLATSRASFAQAETDRINAVYEYHKAFAALESTVGRPIR